MKLPFGSKRPSTLIVAAVFMAIQAAPLAVPRVGLPPYDIAGVGEMPSTPVQLFDYMPPLQPLANTVHKPAVHSSANQSGAIQNSTHTTLATVQPQADPVVSPLIKETVLGVSIVSRYSGTTYPNHVYTTMTTPNDPNASQWWVSAVNAQAAWDVSTGSSGTVLAIIDTGFALNHEEFAGRWHQHEGEQGPTTVQNPSKLNCTDQGLTLDRSCNLIDDDYDGIVDNEVGPTSEENVSQYNCSDQGLPIDKSCNLVDDDANGFVDDWRGWDFVSFDRSVEAGETDRFGAGTRHGTNVAGIAAASGNNGVGMAGINWGTKILPLQALSDDGSGTTLSVARAIRYAVMQGADVISMSLGGGYPDSFLRQAIREAVAAGVVVVAAAGNDGCNCMAYPANYEEVVAVGALNQSNQPASFSSFGANLDVMAPGVGMHTTDWRSSNTSTAYVSGVAGTSFATPLVSASLALLKGANPSASASELVALLTQSANRLTLSTTQHRSDVVGYGTLDLRAAAVRATTTEQLVERTGLADVSHGTLLVAGTRFELSDVLHVHICQNGVLGTTPVYRLQSGSRVLFSSSLAEIGHATATGFSAQLLGYYCVALPQDSTTSVRLISAHQEFTNSQAK